MEILDRFLSTSDGSFFLFGPRGTGKTTWVRQCFPDALYVDLLKPELYRELAARPERLRERVEAHTGHSPIVVDEVQRVPELLNVVHDLIESPRRHRFILTGSSARRLRRGGVDLLAGRAVVRNLHPFIAAELPEFSLSEALRVGMLPLVMASPQPEETLSAYASLYLEQEVRSEGWARNVGDFSRFLEGVSFSQASLLNIAAAARECEVRRKTAAGYFEVLEDLLLAFRLRVFERRVRRRIISHPKFYFFDAGVFRSLRPRGALDRPEEIEGSALEGLVAQHLRAWVDYSAKPFDLYFWRTPAGVEVDFIIYGPAGFWAIEVKNTGRVRPEDLRGLRTFREDYPESQALLLYRGKDWLKAGDVLCLPVTDFLRTLRPDSDLPDA